MTNNAHTPQSPQELKELAVQLAGELAAVLAGRRLPTFVVLHALMSLHRYTALQLPTDLQGDVAMQLGQYAGELLHASATGHAPVDSTLSH